VSLSRGALLVVFAATISGCAAPTAGSSPAAESADVSSHPPTRTPRPTAPATPSPPPTPRPAGTYLALGDSLAVGVGATDPARTGYVPLLFAAFRDADEGPRLGVLRNLAVGGETSTSMIESGQLAAALDAIATADPPIGLVTLDIGGNDLLRLLGTETCAADPGGPACLQLLAQSLRAFEVNYRRIVGDLAEALAERAPEARLTVMTYFNPFSGTEAAYESAGQLALLGSDRRLDCGTDDPQARGMNDIIACVGRELGALPVDVQPGFDGLGLELTHIGSQDIHANDRGYELIADEFATALRAAR
jgi:lysophospholipase L1-like esterase